MLIALIKEEVNEQLLLKQFAQLLNEPPVLFDQDRLLLEQFTQLLGKLLIPLNQEKLM